MMNWFQKNCVELDGRVIWWEHMISYLPKFLLAGLVLSRFFEMPFILIGAGISGIVFSLWSYQQDLVAHLALNEKQLEALLGTDQRVPDAKVGWAIFLSTMFIMMVFFT